MDTASPGLGLFCDLVNMTGNLQDEDLFFVELDGGPSNSIHDSSSSEDLAHVVSCFTAFDFFSLTKGIDAPKLDFREGFS